MCGSDCFDSRGMKGCYQAAAGTLERPLQGCPGMTGGFRKVVSVGTGLIQKVLVALLQGVFVPRSQGSPGVT